MSLAVLCLTPSARDMAVFLARGLEADLHVHRLLGEVPGASVFDRLADRLAELWAERRGLVVVAPTGVVVRGVAPLLEHKTRDPGVVVLDALGRWAVPVCGGHEGGANALSVRVSNLIGAEPVVTTASEAVRDLVAGLGCRRGASAAQLREALEAALERAGESLSRLRLLATARPKRDEPGLLELARELDLPLLVVHDLEIRSRRRVRRTAASRRVRLPAVAQPAALAAGRRTRCVLTILRRPMATVSLARESSGWWVSDPATRPTEPPRP